jgi:hypothetical protein
MEWNVFPNYKIPIEFVWYDEQGEMYVENIGWISTPDIQQLKKDADKNRKMIKI